jgi:hypothetical protein
MIATYSLDPELAYVLLHDRKGKKDLTYFVVHEQYREEGLALERSSPNAVVKFHPRNHAKFGIVPGTAYMGSHNFVRYFSRELMIETTSRKTIQALTNYFHTLWAESQE